MYMRFVHALLQKINYGHDVRTEMVTTIGVRMRCTDLRFFVVDLTSKKLRRKYEMIRLDNS